MQLLIVVGHTVVRLEAFLKMLLFKRDCGIDFVFRNLEEEACANTRLNLCFEPCFWRLFVLNLGGIDTYFNSGYFHLV